MSRIGLVLSGTAAVIAIQVAELNALKAETIEDIVARLEAREKANAARLKALEEENAALRQRVRRIEASKGGSAAGQSAVQVSPGPAPAPPSVERRPSTRVDNDPLTASAQFPREAIRTTSPKPPGPLAGCDFRAFNTCFNFGANAQLDLGVNTGSATPVPGYFGNAGTRTGDATTFNGRARGEFDVDTRTQTAYGPLRSFTRLRVDVLNQGDSFNRDTVDVDPALPRGYLQWAGWTFGRVKSLADVPAFGPDGANTLHEAPNTPDTYYDGRTEVSYTWELGSGMTFNVGANLREAKPVSNLSTFAWANPGSNPSTSISGQRAPNPFVAFKVSQAWGRWDTSLNFNSIQSTYYTAATAPGSACTGVNLGTDLCGRPTEAWGWAVASGLIVNTPWLALGDNFGVFGMVGAGAGAYTTGNNFTSPGLFGSDNRVALGPLTDAVYLNGTGFELTTSWTVGSYFTHYWTPNFTTTIFGSHSGISYNDTIKTDRWFCGPSAANNFLAFPQGISVNPADPCNPDFGFTTIGAHTDWYPVPGFRLGVEVMYTQIDTAFKGAQLTLPRTDSRPAGAYTAKDESVTSVVFRAQRSWPAGGE
jgi:Porin subfamily